MVIISSDVDELSDNDYLASESYCISASKRKKMKPEYSEGITKSTEIDMRLMRIIVSLTSPTVEECLNFYFIRNSSQYN